MASRIHILPQQEQTRPPDGQLQEDTRPVRSDLVAVVRESIGQGVESGQATEEAHDHVPDDGALLLGRVDPADGKRHEGDVELKPDEESYSFCRRGRCGEGVIELVCHCQASVREIGMLVR